MRLTIDVRMLANSGIGTYLRHIVPRLIDLNAGGQIDLVGKADQIAAFPWSRRDNVSVVDLRSPIFSVHEQIFLPSRIPTDSDLFWSPHFNIPLLYRGKLLTTVHDVLHLSKPRYAGGLHKILYGRALFQALTRKADAIICVSRFTADELMRFSSAKASRIVVIHHGIGEEWYSLQKGNRPHEKPYFLFVGNLKPNKNLPALISAFEAISQRIPHDLIIVGKAEGFRTGDASVKARASRLGARVIIAGSVDDLRLKQYYIHASALVMPSLYEGFGFPPLEAMACGCPVIVSSAASLPEVCGEAALYIDPRDIGDIGAKMMYLASNDAVGAELRERGIERARQFSWNKCARETSAVMARLCE